MLEPYEYEPTLKEDGYPVDKDSYSDDVGLTYLSMSASGDVTAPVIYAHSGNPEDYDWLEEQGIDPRGKIAIVRYSVPYSYRGFKAWEAERRGVKALIVYSDPMEDGYVKGEVFPDGPWGPESHIQRGAISYDFIVPGDPLTPGWASTEGAERIAKEDARSIPGIIAVPMSWRDAKPILENLGGPLVPRSWQGGLPITYHAGPGPAKLRVTVEMDDVVRPIQVVVGSIRGTEEPDRMVVLGNHRDAWVYGGVDPSSGTATQLELARVLGEMAKQGKRPRRTLVLADWDAEEVHLTGSTEWGEQFADVLSQGAIAYLNVDMATSGPDFKASAVASLNPLVLSVVNDVIDPNSRRSILKTWRKRLRGDADRDTETILIDNELGSGSDYTVFLNFLGVPIVDMAFSGPYGVYHSQYDNYYWVTHFGDPGFRYMTAMAEVWGRLALRLANAEIYPYDFSLYAEKVNGFLAKLGEQKRVQDHLDLSTAERALDSWADKARELQLTISRSLDGGIPAADFKPLNEVLVQLERHFLLDEGIPDRPWFKHALYAPRYTYAAMMFPGVQEAVDEQDWDRASRELDRIVRRFQALTEQLSRAVALAKKSAEAEK
jgi:N-acetylated-alpha-linked acidic dipeptidase